MIGEEGYCKYCKHNDREECAYSVMKDLCPTDLSQDSLLDALEFSERVAARLAEAVTDLSDCFYDERPCSSCPAEYVTCNSFQRPNICRQNILKWARLEVEKEMGE